MRATYGVDCPNKMSVFKTKQTTTKKKEEEGKKKLRQLKKKEAQVAVV